MENRKFLPLPGLELRDPSVVYPIARFYTNCTIPPSSMTLLIEVCVAQTEDGGPARLSDIHSLCRASDASSQAMARKTPVILTVSMLRSKYYRM
jgi:hypothetical protein